MTSLISFSNDSKSKFCFFFFWDKSISKEFFTAAFPFLEGGDGSSSWGVLVVMMTSPGEGLTFFGFDSICGDVFRVFCLVSNVTGVSGCNDGALEVEMGVTMFVAATSLGGVMVLAGVIGSIRGTFPGDLS